MSFWRPGGVLKQAVDRGKRAGIWDGGPGLGSGAPGVLGPLSSPDHSIDSCASFICSCCSWGSWTAGPGDSATASVFLHGFCHRRIHGIRLKVPWRKLPPTQRSRAPRGPRPGGSRNQHSRHQPSRYRSPRPDSARPFQPFGIRPARMPPTGAGECPQPGDWGHGSMGKGANRQYRQYRQTGRWRDGKFDREQKDVGCGMRRSGSELGIPADGTLQGASKPESRAEARWQREHPDRDRDRELENDRDGT